MNKKYMLTFAIFLLFLSGFCYAEDKNKLEIKAVESRNSNVINETPYFKVFYNKESGYDIAKKDLKGYLYFVFSAEEEKNNNIKISYEYINAYGKNKKVYRKKDKFIFNKNTISGKSIYKTKIYDTVFEIYLR